MGIARMATSQHRMDRSARTIQRRSHHNTFGRYANMKMKLRHWVFLALVAIAVLFLWHNYQMHGGVGGVKSGLGLGMFGKSGGMQ